jgi:serine/threonine protein kinase
VSIRWVNDLTWDEQWETVTELNGGSQAAAKIVKSRVDQREAFLKILNRQHDLERRARFFREAAAYASFTHAGVPRFVESNAIHHQDEQRKLYIVMELIEGPTLSEFVIKRRMDFESATTFTKALLEIVVALHGEGWVHRDINWNSRWNSSLPKTVPICLQRKADLLLMPHENVQWAARPTRPASPSRRTARPLF